MKFIFTKDIVQIFEKEYNQEVEAICIDTQFLIQKGRL